MDCKFLIQTGYYSSNITFFLTFEKMFEFCIISNSPSSVAKHVTGLAQFVLSDRQILCDEKWHNEMKQSLGLFENV